MANYIEALTFLALNPDVSGQDMVQALWGKESTRFQADLDRTQKSLRRTGLIRTPVATPAPAPVVQETVTEAPVETLVEVPTEAQVEVVAEVVEAPPADQPAPEAEAPVSRKGRKAA